MTDLFLTSAAADAEVTAGSGTKWKCGKTAGAAAAHLNKNSVAGPTAPLQMTDGAAGTDGTVVAWYTPPLQAVTIAGQIVCSLWTRENATANNVAPTIRIERCSADGTVLGTIVAETTSHGAGEMGTTAGGASDVVTVTAGNVTDTAIAEGERLRVTLWIDDAAGQGGTGNMASGGRGEAWVNGPTGSQGQARLAFTESVLPVPATAPDPTGDVVTVDSTTTGNTVFASSRVIAIPAGATTMDVAAVYISRWTTPTPGATMPSGFVHRGQVANGDEALDIFLKRLTDEESGTWTFDWAAAGSKWTTAQCELKRGVDRDVDLTTLRLNTATGTGASVPTTSLTSVPEGAGLDWHITNESGSGTKSYPSPWVEDEDNDVDATAHQDSVAAGNFTASGATVSASSNTLIAALLEFPAEPAAGGTVTVTPDHVAQAQAVEAPAVTQLHVIQPDNLAQAQAAAAPTVDVLVTLVPVDLAQAQVVDAATVAVTVPVAPDALAQAQAVEQPGLTQVHVVAPAAVDQAQTVDVPSLGQAHNVAPSDVQQGQSVDQPTVQQAHTLAPADGVQAQGVDQPAVTQVHVLAPADVLQAQTVDTTGLGGTVVITPAALDQAQSAAEPVVMQLHQLEPVDLAQTQALDAASVGNEIAITPVDLSQVQAVESPTLGQLVLVTPADLGQGQTLAEPVLVQLHVIVPTDLDQGQEVEEATLVEEAPVVTLPVLAVGVILDGFERSATVEGIVIGGVLVPCTLEVLENAP